MPPRLYDYSPDSQSPATPGSSRIPHYLVSPTTDAPYSSLNEALGTPTSAYPPSADKEPAHMSSDGRYLYHQPQGAQPMQAAYDYPPYASAPYDPAQMPQHPHRQMRPAPAHSPPHPQSFQPQPPPQPPYQPPYASASYPVQQHPQQHHQPPPQPQQHPQWTGDGWAQYAPNPAPPFASAPAVHDPAFTSGPGRPDAYQQPRMRSSASTPQPQPPPPQQQQQQQQQPPQAKREASQPAGRVPNPSAPPGLDFHKLLESYRLAIHEAQALGSAPTPPPDVFERIRQATQFGWQVLDTAASAPPAAPEMPREATPAGAGAPVKREGQPVQEGQVCLGCSATSTPEWRRGPMGPRTLCNACGLVYAKMIKRRTRDAAGGGRGGAKGRAARQGFGDGSSGEGASDDDESFNSPGPGEAGSRGE
ncbi:hypothetical protein GLOTRDRAFT_138328 [Gloeophyllum trabeum ATCC 11539]|uniref:GATA-type domain-containing protein n=1 Tax=Gloeophyllum trabeum (strain ATCC 11539 / FP-39264 / Madison 617) TaxID=670483 RepID=S7Q9R5_GLOTA|nr:uncharacterized protein GLOTRDRAFT_138328 [Gloeophyllum trabeum ATCC 11539]EPQ56661.1 hypothetical protein GLOTRDRAFT_138328 [Gloeophyllum trabeum ATCC 11539]